MWRNEGPENGGGWRFTDISKDSGTDAKMNGMAVAVGDYDLVGHLGVTEGVAWGAVFFDAERWYEIDNLADLNEAEKLYEIPRSSISHSLSTIESRDSLD